MSRSHRSFQVEVMLLEKLYAYVPVSLAVSVPAKKNAVDAPVADIGGEVREEEDFGLSFENRCTLYCDYFDLFVFLFLRYNISSKVLDFIFLLTSFAFNSRKKE